MTVPTEPPANPGIGNTTIDLPIGTAEIPRCAPSVSIGDLPGAEEVEEHDPERPRLYRRLAASHRTPVVLLTVVSLGSLASRVLPWGKPNGLVFDENYYVSAARTILRTGVDPNREHPPLAKAMIAGTIRVFGDNPLGWRLAPFVFATAAILCMYWLVRAAKGSQWLALGSATLMAMDNLFLVQGRIAMLDIFVLAFLIAGVALYLRDRPLLAGLVIGVGACTKLVGLYGLVVIVIFEVLRLASARGVTGPGRERQPEHRLAALATCAAATITSLLGVLYLLDRTVTTFTNPFDHIRFMVGYGSNDTRYPGVPGVKFAPTSSAWRWLVNRVPDPYYRSFTTTGSHPGRTLVYFQGRMNPFIIYMAAPALLLAAGAAWKRRDQVSFLIVAWFVGTYVPFVALSFQHHASYLFYMLVVLPAVYLAVARMFSARYVPSLVTAGYSLLVAYGLWALYPFRAISL
ncbi:MAG: phospholipid carrier-dependent glycosyltransferase [Actinomycetota bacterium]|nr:phospholipid carrier-dependent glycosyltransferase [Actinomycetota bacterium]